MFKRKQLLIALFILSIIIVIAALAYMNSTYSADSTFQPERMDSATKSGHITQAVLSRDGTLLAYGRDDGDGKQSLWLANLKQGDPLDNAAQIKLGDETVSYTGLSFSHDGDYLYYAKYSGSGITGELYSLKVKDAGKERVSEKKIASDRLPRLFTFAVSPVTGQLAYFWSEGTENDKLQLSLRVMDVASGRVTKLKEGNNILAVTPAWKPDGRTIIYAVQPTDHPGVDLVETPATVEESSDAGNDNRALRLTEKYVRNIACLSDDSGLLVSASEREHGPFRLTYISSDGLKRVELKDNVPEDCFGITLSNDSRKLVTVEDTMEARIISTEIGKENVIKEVQAEGKPLKGGPNDFYGFAWLSDKEIVYEHLEHKDGKQNLFRTNIENQQQKPLNLTNDVGDNYDPSVTPDKQFIVFASTRTGHNRIWKMDTYGRNQTLLSHNDNEKEEHTVPFCAGDWVYYMVKRGPEKYGLWKVRIDGAEDRPVLGQESYLWPAVSAENKIAAFYDRDEKTEGDEKTQLAVIGPGEATKIDHYKLPASANTWAELRWLNTENNRGIVFINDGRGSDGPFSNLRLQVEGSEEQRDITKFKDKRIFRYEIAPDGRRLLISQGSVVRNVKLIAINRPTRLDEFLRRPFMMWVRDNSALVISILTILIILYILYFSPLPLDVLTTLWPKLNSVATLLYVIRGGDWRMFRAYRDNLRYQLRKADAEAFYKPLPVKIEGEGVIRPQAVVGRVLNLIKDKPVIITGPGGAGKSALLRQLALGCLDGKELINRLPIYLNPDTDGKRTIKAQLIEYLKRSSSYVNEPILDAQLKRGSFFFIIDGVSELTEEEAQKLWDELPSLFPLASETSQRNVVALAGRYYDGIELELQPGGNREVPKRVELLEVELEDLKTFCEEYLAVLRKKDRADISPETVNTLAENIIGKSEPAAPPAEDVNSLAENLQGLPCFPLIIRLAVADYESKGQIPKNKLELFKNSLERIRPKKIKLQIHTPDLFELMHRLAWEKFVENGQRELVEDELVKMIEVEQQQTDLFRHYQPQQLSALDILHDLLYSGIMIRQLSRIRFWHDSYEDYLCACHFQRKWTTTRSKARSSLEKLREERAFSEVVEFISRMAREVPDADLIAALEKPLAQRARAGAPEVNTTHPVA